MIGESLQSKAGFIVLSVLALAAVGLGICSLSMGDGGQERYMDAEYAETAGWGGPLGGARTIGSGPALDRPPQPSPMTSAFVETAGADSMSFRIRLPDMQADFRRDELLWFLIDDREASSEGDEAQEGQTVTGTTVRLTFAGANRGVEPLGVGPLPGAVNVLRGRDSSRWRQGLRRYREVIYSDLYPGIDLSYTRSEGGLKSEWRVRAGADPSHIRLRYEGATSVSIEMSELVIETSGGALREAPPVIYQPTPQGRVSIAGGYELDENGDIGFWLEDYDPTLPLVIDPSLEWSTLLGGWTFEEANDIAVDETGAVYVTGWTWSGDFPTTPGAFQILLRGGDGFVTKLDPTGSALAYSTLIGGTDSDAASAIQVDGAGNVWVAGGTNSDDFPLTSDAFDKSFKQGESFVAKLDASGGALLYSTYLGGSARDSLGELRLSEGGDVFVAGFTASFDFPVTPGAFQATRPGSGSDEDLFVSRLDGSGNLVASTYLGGTSRDSVADLELSGEGVFLTGWTESSDYPTSAGAFDTSHNGTPFADAFILRLDSSLASMDFGTFLGASGQASAAGGLAVAASGEVWVGGSTSGSDFPTTADAWDATFAGTSDVFVARFSADGAALRYSTFVGEGAAETVYALELNGSGDVVMGGMTYGSPGPPHFPTTPGAFDTSHNGAWDVFILQMSASGTRLLYSTFLGGRLNDVNWFGPLAVDANDDVYVAGFTASTGFPTTPGAYDRVHSGDAKDVFVTKLRLGPTLELVGTPTAGSPVHFAVSSAPSAETGRVAQVALSCSGTSGIPLPAGSDQVLPLTWDACTALSLSFPAAFQGTIDSQGNASTPVLSFPSVPAGIQVYAAAFTWQFGVGFFSVTPPIDFVTQ